MLKKRTILDLVTHRLIEKENILNFHSFFKVPRKVDLNIDPPLRIDIKKFVQFHANDFAHSLRNFTEKQPVRDG